MDSSCINCDAAFNSKHGSEPTVRIAIMIKLVSETDFRNQSGRCWAVSARVTNLPERALRLAFRMVWEISKLMLPVTPSHRGCVAGHSLLLVHHLRRKQGE
ncbi:hypothetical protein ACTXT7_009742 [Hymenolepis weldensis]